MASSSNTVSGYLQTQIARGAFPGAQYVIGQGQRIIAEDALGLAVVEPERIPVTVDTIYDLASLTKPLVTSLLAVIYADRGVIDLSAPVGDYLNEFNLDGKRPVTLIELLTHTSGLPNWKPLYLETKDPSDVPADIARLLSRPIDSKAIDSKAALVYSDLNYILLGCVLERAIGERLDRIAEREIFNPLDLKRTMFNPPPELMREIAATEHGQMFEQANALEDRVANGEQSGAFPPARAWRKDVIWGEVHDGNAHFLGGVAGHAGLFSTAREVFKIACQLLPESKLVTSDRSRLFRENLTPGYDTARSICCIVAATKDCSAGPALSPKGIGHNGFTGTSVWMDPEKRRVFVLLTNRIHPRVGTVDMKEIRQQFNCLAVESLNK